LILQLDEIDPKGRDTILMKYIVSCKFTHALAFFQWRYHQLRDVDPEKAERNKEIFY